MKPRVMSVATLLVLTGGAPAWAVAGFYMTGWPVVGATENRLALAAVALVHDEPWSPSSNAARWNELAAVALSYDAQLAVNAEIPKHVNRLGAMIEPDAILAKGIFDPNRFLGRGGFRTDEERLHRGDLEARHGVALWIADPMKVIHDKSQVDQILAPDSLTMIVPAPGAVLLGGLGVVLIGRLRRRRSL